MAREVREEQPQMFRLRFATLNMTSALAWRTVTSDAETMSIRAAGQKLFCCFAARLKSRPDTKPNDTLG